MLSLRADLPALADEALHIQNETLINQLSVNAALTELRSLSFTQLPAPRSSGDGSCLAPTTSLLLELN